MPLYTKPINPPDSPRVRPVRYANYRLRQERKEAVLADTSMSTHSLDMLPIVHPALKLLDIAGHDSERTHPQGLVIGSLHQFRMV